MIEKARTAFQSIRFNVQLWNIEQPSFHHPNENGWFETKNGAAVAAAEAAK